MARKSQEKNHHLAKNSVAIRAERALNNLMRFTRVRIGEALKEGKTYQKMSEMAGVDKSIIWRYRHGQRSKDPGILTLLKIYFGLRVPLSHVIFSLSHSRFKFLKLINRLSHEDIERIGKLKKAQRLQLVNLIRAYIQTIPIPADQKETSKISKIQRKK